jgi:glyoxylase-like metal-dependent hydrolase (beta-lactamase superfamily II)
MTSKQTGIASYTSAITRRTALAGAGAALAGGALTGLGGGLLPASPAWALAPNSRSLQLGAFDITIVSDGHLVMPARLAAPDAPADELKAALAANGQTGDMAEPPANVTLIKSGSDVILVDTGAGPNFMPTTGRLLANLEAAGVSPDTITKVVFTHGHPDHFWGALDDFEENPRFANATHYFPAAEWDFWVSDKAEQGLPADRASFVPAARRNLKGIEAKAQRIKPGDDIVAGIRVLATPGHTQGHISLEIAGGSETLLVLGDALTHPIISFAHPEWRPAADHQPEIAAETRRKLLDRLATDKSRVIGYHLPFPGVGRVERKGSAFAYVGEA